MKHVNLVLVLRSVALAGLCSSAAASAPELKVSLSAEPTVVKEGYPLAFRVVVTNAGSRTLSFPGGLEDGFWSRARLMHEFQDSKLDARIKSVGPQDQEYSPGLPPIRLMPDQSLRTVEYVGYQKTLEPREPGKVWKRYEPLTKTPGTHSFWAEFDQDGVVVKSEVLSIRVATADPPDVKALAYLRGIEGLPVVYRFGSDTRKHLGELRVLAFELGNNGYADLARMRFAEWHLYWVERGVEEYCLGATQLTTEQNVQLAQELIESIDLEQYPIPSKVTAIKERLVAAQSKGC
jgi:hypothetical protein